MTTLNVREKFETRESCWKHVDRRHQRRIPMKSHTSRLKIFDSASMSESTPQASGVRATERVSQDFKGHFQTKRLFPINRFRLLKAWVETVVSSHGLGDIRKVFAGRLEPDELVNARSRPKTSKKHLHLVHHRLA